VLQGYLCWRDQKERQITSIYVAGDVPDLHTVFSSSRDLHLSTLGPAVVAFVPHTFLHEACSMSDNLHDGLQLLIQSNIAALRNWIINIGRRDALTRVAHLFCEITVRLWVVGLARDNRFPSPFTQSELASACAISPVHANRIIQELRRQHLLTWQSRTITIDDWQGLRRIARFDADYLGLRSQIAARHSADATSFSRRVADALSI
jgi:CRP-like cAMP-binding protein